MSRPLITFDLDNTLWPVDEVIRHADAAMHDWLSQALPSWQDEGRPLLATHRAAVFAERTDLHHDLSALRREILRRTLRAQGLAEARVDDLAEGALATFLIARQQVTPYDCAEAMLAELAQEHRLIALSNGNADILRMPLGRHFSDSISSARAGFAKPHPRMFELALTGSGHDRAIHVGDHPEQDVGAAQALGWAGIWVNHGGETWPEAMPAADAEARHLAELPALVRALRQR